MGLFIPEKIKVGYQKRQGTYTGKLAYIIYYDEKGKLRKETSWQSWRDNKIEPEEFVNEPTEGFVLNKDVQRCNWSHFGSGRSYIRVYDPRGVEFEVTPENLIAILMESDCNKRMLMGEFVYAWNGTELLVLPCGSEAYQEAVKNTARRHKKVSARDLQPGCSYTQKDGTETIYIGRFLWYKWDHGVRTSKKHHIFWSDSKFAPVQNMNKLAYVNSPEPVQEYAGLVDKYKADIVSQNIVDIETMPAAPKQLFVDDKEHSWQRRVKNAVHFVKCGNHITQYTVELARGDRSNDSLPQFYLSSSHVMDLTTQKVSYPEESTRGHSYHWQRQYSTEEQILKQLADAVRVKFVTESGKKHRLKGLSTWGDQYLQT